MNYLIATLAFLSSMNAHAWGRRGHQIVGETAAEIVGNADVRAHGFDLGFYANAPDIIWKRPATFENERKQHYMDMEKYRAAFKAHPEIKEPFKLSRAEFERTFPTIKTDAGRAYWRVREVFARLTDLAERLKSKTLTRAERQRLQLDWLVTGGALGHYVGDLGQPLHVSENYDGEKTNQHGVHVFFEEICVEEIYPGVATKVNARARAEWPAYTKANASKDVLTLTEALAGESNDLIPALLEIDKQNPRDDRARACGKFEDLIVKRLTASSLLLAELFRRTLGWEFDNRRFFDFAGDPPYIPVGDK